MQHKDEALISQKTTTETTNKNHIVVVGAGLGGLALVSQLKYQAEEEMAVTLIEKRDLDVLMRRQKVIILAKQIHPGELQETNWMAFCMKLFNPNNQYQLNNEGQLIDSLIKDGKSQVIPHLNKRQKFVRKLLRQPVVEEVQFFRNFSIRDLQKALLEYIRDSQIKSLLTINIIDLAEIKAINTKQSMLTLYSAKKEIPPIHFSELVIAEGASRQTLHLLKQELNEKDSKAFSFQSYEKQPPYYNVGIRMKMRSLSAKDKSLLGSYQNIFHTKNIRNKQVTTEAYQRLKNLGWKPRSNQDLPAFVADTNVHTFTPFTEQHLPRIYLATEIPEAIYKIEDEGERKFWAIRWVKNLLAIAFKLPPDSFEFDDKADGINLSFFLSTMEAINFPMISLASRGKVFVIGDAAISSFYLGGISSSLALESSMTLARCLLEKTSPEQFLPFLRVFNLQKDQLVTELESYTTVFSDESNIDEEEVEEFFTAIKNNDCKRVSEYLYSGMNPNVLINDATPLLVALEKPTGPMIELLLSFGANPEKIVDGTTAIHSAKAKNLHSIAEMLELAAGKVSIDRIFQSKTIANI